MSSYGIQVSGFHRKPLSAILADIEEANIASFGPGIIQTADSPLGQLNGVFAEAIAEAWEVAEDCYQSYDPQQAEGLRLDMLAKLRGLQRGEGESDESFRRAIINEGQARLQATDIEREAKAVDGVVYARFHDDLTDEGASVANVGLAVLGGDDAELAGILARYLVPGTSSWGNRAVAIIDNGYCRNINLIRLSEIPVSLDVTVSRSVSSGGCPPPELASIRQALVTCWEDVRHNGKDVRLEDLQRCIALSWQHVDLVSFAGDRGDGPLAQDAPIPIGFFEIASITADNVIVQDA